MAFLEQYEALTDAGDASAAVEAARAQLVGKWLAGKPHELFAELRESRPIFASPGMTFVTKYSDVHEVLARDEVFSVRPYALKMQRIAPTGFILAIDDNPQYQRDVSILRLAFGRDDLPRIREFVAHTAAQLISNAAGNARFDLVQGLSRVVPARLVAHYFGVPGPDERTLMRWARTIFHDLFLNLRNVPAIRDPAVVSGAALSAYLDELITRRESEMASGAHLEDNVLNRLLQMQCSAATRFDNARIRDNLIGMLVGAIETNSKAIAHAADELLRRPQELAAAQAAAIDNNDELLAHYIHEALRFKPQSIGLLRYCEQNYTLAKGTSREAIIRGGTLVFLATWSAMFDASHLDEPEKFRTDRSLTADYLHFGDGLHTCTGQYISRVLILEVMKRLLSVANLRRAAGADGEIRSDGPFPDSFIVEFDQVDTNFSKENV